ncbi:MAG: acyl-ACP--UDP-N-acetylglucosamine O-acyltransferase [Firmicutes bacterium]|jgi:UDP-N-acetylglucosamine acyltransferase|nr:acyl-ACP--UDP-N-acetylglucosamine O-acyltransferase [Bacillota bacterium]
MKVTGTRSFRVRKIHATAIIHPDAIIGQNVTIGPYCVIGEGVVIGDSSRLDSHVVIHGPTTVGQNCSFSSGAVIGGEPQDLRYEGEKTTLIIGNNNVFREYVTINRGTVKGKGETRIGNDNYIMSYGHIAHDCVIGNNVIITGGAALAGHSTVDDYAIIGGLAGIHQFVKVGKMSMIGGMAKISRDVPPYMLVDGNPAYVLGVNIVGMRRHGTPQEIREAMKNAYRILYDSGLTLAKAIGRIESELSGSSEIEVFVEFLKGTTRGIIGGRRF